MFSPLNHDHTRVILLRHGQSTYNALGLYQGSSDRPILTDLGYQQARLTGAFLKHITFDAIYSSPLKRTQETAKEVLKMINSTVNFQTIQIMPQLRETELPLWQGLPFQQVREQFPQQYRCWKQRPHEFYMEVSSVEPKEIKASVSLTQTVQLPSQNQQQLATKLDFFPALDLYERIRKFWQEILPRHIGQTILIVSHGGTNRALISTALGISPAHYHSIEQSNCALSVLNFPKSRLEFATLETMNHASHIGEHLPNHKEGLRLFLIPSTSRNRQQLQHLAQLLKDETIDFSISSELDNSDGITSQVLQNHPLTVQLQVLRQDFLELWQKKIKARNCSKFHKSITGLVVASDRILQRFLGKVFTIKSERIYCFTLQPETLTIVHYPNTEHPPILQAMNLVNLEF
ncbi:MAG: histidine phosphatase family protein [Symploca sp. SIO1C4]|uniref:Histidine phosphatase family protein n=1 Tax=Symploca sp. SIO1C4 TaxID=2607765 RepID=A0A6B3MYQ6_9CYAN|nr:histidine phosphatase family protein [Symploca sp. SIO1C4]